MSTPVRLAVLQSIVDALRAMGPQIGCTYQVARDEDVTLDRRNLATVFSLPAFVVEPEGGGQREFLPANRIKDRFPVVIYGRVDATGLSDSARRLTVFEQLAADVERCLTRDITRGGLAIDTRVLPPREPYIELDPVNSVYLEQPVEVVVRRIYGQPEGS